MWIFAPNKKFIKQYKSLSSDLQKRVELAVINKYMVRIKRAFGSQLEILQEGIRLL